MILIVCGERWTGRREISDLRIELRLFHTPIGFWRNASERTAIPNDVGNSRECMPQPQADPHIQHK
jgi:hypothetical protein